MKILSNINFNQVFERCFRAKTISEEVLEPILKIKFTSFIAFEIPPRGCEVMVVKHTFTDLISKSAVTAAFDGVTRITITTTNKLFDA